MSAWRGALPLSTHTLKIAFSCFGLSSGLALRLASVLKVVYLGCSAVPLAKPSPGMDFAGELPRLLCL